MVLGTSRGRGYSDGIQGDSIRKGSVSPAKNNNKCPTRVSTTRDFPCVAQDVTQAGTDEEKR